MVARTMSSPLPKAVATCCISFCMPGCPLLGFLECTVVLCRQHSASLPLTPDSFQYVAATLGVAFHTIKVWGNKVFCFNRPSQPNRMGRRPPEEYPPCSRN